MKSLLNNATVLLPDEKALLLQTAAGDEIAFRSVFDAYRPRIYSFAFHLTENNVMADEIVQETFLRVWLHRQKLPEVDYFNAWLHSIARNLVTDALKRIAKERLAQASMPVTATISNADEAMTDKEYARLLQEAIGQLPDRQQQIYQLSRDAGIQHAEIAGRLNISRHTVKTHLVLALKSIREYLKYNGVMVLLI
ncbi:MAG: RNA polymerase sigma-70 factor, partial [Bacteroidetes bacterium]|nr:RNA polymerase sigma-70 factor [Bacteroidota bacterium]